MSNTMKRREYASLKLEALGCKVVTAISDRRSGSYAVGHADGSGYFSPTFQSEEGILDWASRNMSRIERHVRRGEPLEPQDFIAHVVSAAAAEAGDDGQALADALAPRMDELHQEADTLGDRDISGLLDLLAEGKDSPTEALSNLSILLGAELSGAPSPR
jgi:hypothetical protein